MIEIDGSYGEGGGQILRAAISLSCLTGKVVRIFNIRANRPKPGLAAQHLKGIEAAKMLTDAEVKGLKLGSTEVIFKPKEVRSGRLKIDIGTAGSVTLILQSILLPSLLKGCEFTITGGTDVRWAPTADYFKNVTLAALSRMGVKCEFEVLKRGYYPKGGGLVRVKTSKSSLEGLEFSNESGEIVQGISHCSNLPDHVAKRQAETARKLISKEGFDSEIEVEVLKGFSTGSAITLWNGFKGGSSLGERGKPAEKVGEEAALEILTELKDDSVVDRHLADQLMVFGAVAEGRTSYTTSEITLHQKSNAYVISRFLGDVVKLEGKRVEIKGCGLI
ncbi:MAG: RNA 3'-terminal phosphate cyclase [Archaeoglobus sp.]|nr:RNA 3'-terminal phosphate cyclase [Archaeoglobus sp.]